MKKIATFNLTWTPSIDKLGIKLTEKHLMQAVPIDSYH